MSIYDIIMLVVFVGAILFGYWKGLAWQLASVAAIVVSYIVSVRFREPVSNFISAEQPWNKIAAMLILFLGCSLVIWTIYASVHKSLKKMELKGFDSQAGALLGAVKGALLCMIITMFSVSMIGERAHHAIHLSRSGYYIVRGITQVSAIVPAEIGKYVQPYVDDFHEAIGHDGSQPLNQMPQFNQSNQMLGQGSQNPNQVPSYRGTWQSPTAPAANNGFGGQVYLPNGNPVYSTSNPPASNGANSGFNWSWNANQNPNSQQTGYQQNPISNTSNNGGANNGVNNAWPDLNFQVDTRQIFDAATEAARRKLFEPKQP